MAVRPRVPWHERYARRRRSLLKRPFELASFARRQEQERTPLEPSIRLYRSDGRRRSSVRHDPPRRKGVAPADETPRARGVTRENAAPAWRGTWLRGSVMRAYALPAVYTFSRRLNLQSVARFSIRNLLPLWLYFIPLGQLTHEHTHTHTHRRTQRQTDRQTHTHFLSASCGAADLRCQPTRPVGLRCPGTGGRLRRPPKCHAPCAGPREPNLVHGRNLASRRGIDLL